MSRIHLFAGFALLSLVHGLGCLALLDADSLEGATLVDCEPASSEACYEGPAGTEGVGVCAAGARTCCEEGTGFGECVGQVLPGVECGIDTVDEDCDGLTGAHVWSQKFGGVNLQRILGSAVAPDGSSVFTGYSYGTMEVGKELLGEGTFVFKLDPAGEVLWAKRFGFLYSSFGLSIAFDPQGDVVLTADTSAAIDFGGGPLTPPKNTDWDVIAKLRGADGSHVWSQIVGGGADDTEDSTLAVDSNGNIVVTGVFRGKLVWSDGSVLDNTSSDAHMFLALLGPDGKIKESHDYGHNLYPRRVTFDSSGAIALVGNINGMAELGTATLGNGALTSFVARFKADGEPLWGQVLGTTTDNFFGRGVTALLDGTIVAAVPFSGLLEVAETKLTSSQLDNGVVAFTPAGNLRWARVFGGKGMDTPWAVSATTDGGLVLGGAFQQALDVGLCPVQSNANYDAFLMKLDSEGQPRWIHAFGDLGPALDDPKDLWPTDVVVGVHGTDDGGVVIAAQQNGTIDWGGGSIFAPPKGDVVVARYAR